MYNTGGDSFIVCGEEFLRNYRYIVACLDKARLAKLPGSQMTYSIRRAEGGVSKGSEKVN